MQEFLYVYVLHMMDALFYKHTDSADMVSGMRYSTMLIMNRHIANRVIVAYNRWLVLRNVPEARVLAGYVLRDKTQIQSIVDWLLKG